MKPPRWLVAAIFFWLASAPTAADQGMWMPHQMAALNLNAQGLAMNAAELYRKDGTGLMSAVVNLGGGTGEFVSAEGLILTNHHVAFGALQRASSQENDYIQNGFLASTRDREIQAPGYTADVLIGYEEVTPAIRKRIKPGMTYLEIYNAIDRAQKELIAASEKAGRDLRCTVASMYSGNQYYLFTYKRLRDVRLVYAPPQDLGNFGGEVDNWMWPRHTCDFSFLRAYVSRDGTGAEYHAENVPYHPKSILKISLAGVKDGDFTFVMGYPGRTYRNETLSELRLDREALAKRIGQFREIIAFFESAGQGKRDVEIKYASLVKGLYNSLKNMQGKVEGMDKIDLLGRKKADEEAFRAWAAQDPERRKRYGDILDRLDAYMKRFGDYSAKNSYLAGLTGLTGSTLLGQAYLIDRTVDERQKPDAAREPQFEERNLTYVRQSIRLAERSYDLAVDRAFLKRNLEKLVDMPSAQVPAALADLARAKSVKAVDDYVDGLYDKTTLAGADRRLELLDLKPARLAAAGDPLIRLAAGLENEVRAQRDEGRALGQERSELKRVYEAALLERSGGRFAPDANGTIRFTYGPVKGYTPRDAVCYLPQTSLKGVIEKDTGSFPFRVPDKIKALYKGRDYGRYRDPGLDEIPCCFLNTTNVTGGNSGSPTLNARGEQVGIIFDMTYESVIGDYVVVPELQRSISVDVRYVLFVTDKFSGAANVIAELGL